LAGSWVVSVVPPNSDWELIPPLWTINRGWERRGEEAGGWRRCSHEDEKRAGGEARD
jgi:hypothetical protein